MVDLRIQLPDGFLEPEIRCDYLVSAQMKEVWAVELDLLAQLLEVCDRQGIRIFARGGTLLGAVRHRGFIPWDDDIDMAMLRSDFDRLCEVAPNEFREPYFFQTEYTDPGSLRGHAQLRNSHTTGILKSEQHMGFRFNQGIFIDIFPLDNVIDDKNLFTRQARDARIVLRVTKEIADLTSRYRRVVNCNIKGHIQAAVHDLAGDAIMRHGIEEELYASFETVCRRYNNIQTESVSLLSISYEDRRLLLRVKDLEDLTMAPFEFLMIPIERNYDRGLRTRYGDYMTPHRTESCHGGVIFDTDRPYTDFI